MEKKLGKKWSSRTLNIRVTNRLCGRVDFHKNLSEEEIGWIELDPNLIVEVVDKMDRDNDY